MSAQSARRETVESCYRKHPLRNTTEIDYIDFSFPARIVGILVGARLWNCKFPRAPTMRL